MSVRLKYITEYIEELAPKYLAETWDNVGLMVGDENTEVSKILVALDCRDEILDEAIEKGADMIITHHPFIFKGIKNMDYKMPLARKIAKAVKNDIAIYSAHTNLDIAEGGTNTVLARLLDLENTEGLMPAGEGTFLGRTGYIKDDMTFGEFALYTKEKLGADSLNINGDLNRKVKKAGLCTGKGCDMDMLVTAAEKGCDVYISGDIGYHDAQNAEDLGLCLIDGTHYLTEVIVVPEICRYIKEKFKDIEVIASEINGQTLMSI